MFNSNYGGFILSGGGSDPSLEARVTALEDAQIKSTYFAVVSATSGTITPPSNATILLDQFASSVDALVSEIDGLGYPTFQTPQTAGGAYIATTLDASGNYVLSGTPASAQVAIIYVYSIERKYFDIAYSIGFEETNLFTNSDKQTLSNAFVRGGNSFGAAVSLGTNDAYNLTIKAHNSDRITLSSTDAVIYSDNIYVRTGTGQTKSWAEFRQDYTAIGFGTGFNSYIEFGQEYIQFTQSHSGSITNNFFLPEKAAGDYTLATTSDVSGAFLNGGNSFGAAASIGTNDAYDLTIKRNNIAAIVVASSSISIPYTTTSTSGSTGALTVAGGVGIVGALNLDDGVYVKNATTSTYNKVLFSNANNALTLGNSFYSTLNITGGAIFSSVARINRTAYSSAGESQQLSIEGSTTGASITSYNGIKVTTTFAASANSGAFISAHLAPTINQTGTATQKVVGVYYNASGTILGTHYAWESTVGDMLVGGAGRYLLNDGGTAKVSLDVSASNTLRIGSGFTTVLLAAHSFTSANGNISSSTSVVWTGDSNSTPFRFTRASVTGTNNNNIQFFRITGNYSPSGGTTGTWDGLIIDTTVGQSGGTNIVTLVSVNPSITNLTGTLYGIRSQINTGTGTRYNIYADGTAPNYFEGMVAMGGGVPVAARLTLGASTSAMASINFGEGVDVSSPQNGDFWMTTTGAFMRINDVTYSVDLTAI